MTLTGKCPQKKKIQIIEKHTQKTTEFLAVLGIQIH